MSPCLLSFLCLFLLQLSLFPVSLCVKPHVIIFFPSQTLCHKGVDDKMYFLQEEKRKAVIDGVSTLLSVLSPDCFG